MRPSEILLCPPTAATTEPGPDVIHCPSGLNDTRPLSRTA
jgi:hypothetical protein